VITHFIMLAILDECIYRITVFTFVVEETQEVPTVTFMGEHPYLQYVSKPNTWYLTCNSYILVLMVISLIL